VALVGSLLAGCSSTESPAGAGTSGAGIPASAFADTTGVSPGSVTIANISTQAGGLFAGAAVGTEAYAAYVNAQGGIAGRKLVVRSSDDQFAGALNKQQTRAAVQSDFATVGGFSLEDAFGGSVLAANPQMPNVSESLDPATAKLPNTFSPSPNAPGWPLGPLTYFKQRFPDQVLHTGTIVADLTSTVTAWEHEKVTMEHLGYRVIYDPALPPTTTDFTQNIVAMKNAGVQILFLEQLPVNYASAAVKDMNQQNFHPVLVLGAPAYSESLVADSGGPGSIDGAYFEQSSAFYLGEDAAAVPAVRTFLDWVQHVSPGFHADFFTLYGWLCTQLFADALRAAGAHPTRGSLLEALRRTTSFTGSNLIPDGDPARKAPISCYVLGRIAGGTFQRMDDPPVSGLTHGFRCDQPFFYPS
jgi:ABC-type branched-subunit amino acid transport system substrate-binding protein